MVDLQILASILKGRVKKIDKIQINDGRGDLKFKESRKQFS